MATTPTAPKEISLLLEARTLLRTAPKSDALEALRYAIEEFQERYDLIKVSCTRTALRDLVGSATVMLTLMSKVSAPPPNSPTAGGLKEGAELVHVDKARAVG